MTEYLIVIEKAEKNYAAYCPDLPGVIATGPTRKETLDLMKEAIESEGLYRYFSALPQDQLSYREQRDGQKLMKILFSQCKNYLRNLAGRDNNNNYSNA